MGGFANLRDKLSRYYKFTPHEVRGLAISILVIAFIISFKNWGASKFDPVEGFYNLFNAILIVALSILVHDAAQKISGMVIGFRIEFRVWTLGLFLSLIIAFVSNGVLWLIVPGSFLAHHIGGHRLGKVDRGLGTASQKT